MPTDDGFKDLHFPKGGLNVVSSFSTQPNVPIAPDSNIYARTAVIATNVRGYETVQDRVRGGSRPGLSKLIKAQVNGATFVVQGVTNFTVVGTSSFSSVLQQLIGYYALDGNLNDSSGNGNNLGPDVPPPLQFGTGLIKQDLTSGGGFIKPIQGISDQAFSVSAWFFSSAGAGGTVDGAGVGWGRGSEVGNAFRLAYRSNGTNGAIVVRDRAGVNQISTGFTLSLNAWHFAVMTYNGTVTTLYVDGASVGTYTFTLQAGWSKLTFGINTVGATLTSPEDEVGVWARPLKTTEITTLYNSGAGINPVTSLELSESGRVVYLVAVSQGVVQTALPGASGWSSTVNNTGETPPLNYTGRVFSAPNNQLLFFVDGINYCYFKPQTNSVELWSSGITAGSLPQDSDANFARLICTWRGRTVLSGLLKDPQNWFMSRVSNPFDFNYSPLSPGPADAVAGNNSNLGLIGEPVMALIPYNDDILVVGCTNSIWMFRGDPAAGGQIDRVSDKIGMAWATGWTKDPYGNLYFMSNRTGIYQMVPGQLPVRVSQSIEPLLKPLDMGRNIFLMEWDDRAQGLCLYVTWQDQPQATFHLFYEQRTQAWFKVVRANLNHNPLCTCVFDGNVPGDRVILEGHWDGYVRQNDYTATTDDLTPIASEVWIGPLLTQDFDEIRLDDIQAILGDHSGTVTYTVYVGDTPESALASTGIVINTISGGRNNTDLVRESGHVIYVKLTSTAQWAMEAIRVRVKSLGRVRMRA